MDDYPVKLGSILFTMVEPHREHVVAYNRWYERDHFYAGCLVGPGILAGRRWVATVPYKKLRYPAETPITPDPMVGSYLALYWISADGSREWGTWAAKEVHRLHDAGRMFPHRDHVHTQMYVYRGAVRRDPDGVPPELALDHPFPGLVVAFGSAPDRRAADAWLRDEYLPRALADSPTAMALSFTPVPVPPDAPEDVPRANAAPDRFLQLFFLDTDPADAWEAHFARLGDDVARSGVATLLWVAPFIPTIPGTDTYTGELW